MGEKAAPQRRSLTPRHATAGNTIPAALRSGWHNLCYNTLTGLLHRLSTRSRLRGNALVSTDAASTRTDQSYYSLKAALLQVFFCPCGLASGVRGSSLRGRRRRLSAFRNAVASAGRIRGGKKRASRNGQRTLPLPPREDQPRDTLGRSQGSRGTPGLAVSVYGSLGTVLFQFAAMAFRSNTLIRPSMLKSHSTL